MSHKANYIDICCGLVTLSHVYGDFINENGEEESICVLGLKYRDYFNAEPAVESINFYWNDNPVNMDRHGNVYDHHIIV